jgi:nucleoside-diphosphate-sugar epimerase
MPDSVAQFDKKIVLPGGAGLVGQNLVTHLQALGYSKLVVIDKHQTNLMLLKARLPQVITVEADLAVDGAWQEQFEGANAVVMLQAQIGDPKLEPFVRNNITATENVLAAIKRHAVPYTVHISSSVVESVADDFYTQTKKEQEKIVLDSGVKCVVLRPTLMFGWYDRKHLGWLARFMQKVPVFPIPGDGKFMRQPLYAGDFCNIIASCLRSQISDRVFNITGLEKLNYIDIIRTIKKAVNAKAVLIKIPYALFYVLLQCWAVFDRNPPFTAAQLKALIAHDEFEVIDWPSLFVVSPTPFELAIDKTFNTPVHSNVTLEF